MSFDREFKEKEKQARDRPAFWVSIVILSQGWKFILSIISTVVMARLLKPSDFGLVATVGPLVALADLLRDLGFTQAIIQRKNITVGQINSLFWLSIGVTFFIASFLSVTSPLVAIFFQEPRLKLLLIVSSWTLLLGTLSALPIALLSRQLRFPTIAIIESVATGLSLVSAVACAWFTQSYWSLLFASTIYSFAVAMMALVASGWRPGLPKIDRAVAEMVRFGAGVSVANISNFVARNADNVMIAKVSGPISLGIYDRAYKLMLVPLMQITWPISRVLIPLLSKKIDQPSEYARTYSLSISCLMIFGQPGLLFCIVFSEPVIQLLLGPKWNEVAPIFAWLGAASLQQIVTSSIVWLFISQSRTKELAILGVINSAVALLSFSIGLPWGPLGVAVSFTILDSIVRAPFSWWYTTRKGPVSLAAIVSTILPHAIAIAGCTIVLAFTSVFIQRLTFPTMGLGVFITYALYVLILMLWDSKRILLSLCLQHGLVLIKKYT